MNFIINVVVGFCAFLHLYFLILEMFLWTRPLGLKIFRQSYEKAKENSVLAANQGLYNGFLATGLLWALLQQNIVFSMQLKVFFLACVSIAGIYGGISFNRRIFFIQGLPGLLGLLFILLSS